MIEFELRFVPRRYPDVVQRMAVMPPLVGKVGRGDDAVRAATKQIGNMWRARAAALVEHGWSPANADAKHVLNYAANCRPTFAAASPPTRPCKHAAVCPYCYARRVREIYEAIDKAFPAADADGLFRYHLVFRKYVYEFPIYTGPVGDLQERLVDLLQGITVKRTQAFRASLAVGAFSYATLEPTQRETWKITYRQLYQMPERVGFPAELSRALDGASVRVYRYSRPTRKAVLFAVARACRYPEAVMFGDAGFTAQLLDVMRGCRFKSYAMLGNFRGRKR